MTKSQQRDLDSVDRVHTLAACSLSHSNYVAFEATLEVLRKAIRVRTKIGDDRIDRIFEDRMTAEERLGAANR